MSANLLVVNPHSINPKVIELLKDALNLAREGKLLNCCLAADMSDNAAWSGAAGKPTSSLIGEMVMQTRLLVEALQEHRDR